MRIVVSACLLGENCKYSGGNNENKAVLNFVKDHELIPVCPEVLGGLPVPRMPADAGTDDPWMTHSGAGLPRH